MFKSNCSKGNSSLYFEISFIDVFKDMFNTFYSIYFTGSVSGNFLRHIILLLNAVYKYKKTVVYEG